MKLDRNINSNGTGKYAIINLRKLIGITSGQMQFDVQSALNKLESAGVLEWGTVGGPDECFLIKLKDRHAHAALTAYAQDARPFDSEWADQVLEMTKRAGPNSPYCKIPD